MRSIDKRAEETVSLVEGERPGVLVGISLRKKSTKVTISMADLEAAAQNSMKRSEVRTKIKRAIDAMMFESTPIASTKMLRGNTSAEGFFRPAQGQKRGRR